MPSPPSHEKYKLSYPAFCAEFLDDEHLVVAGGGGENRSGVPNGVTVFNVANQIREVSSLDLPRTEDGVMSMAIVPPRTDDLDDSNGAEKDGSTTTRYVICGVNESWEPVKSSNSNRHFRTYAITSSSSDANKSYSFARKGATQLFKPKNWEMLYQRTAVCSKSGRVGVVVSSGAKDKEPFASELVAVRLDEDDNDSLKPEVVARIRSTDEIVDASVVPVHQGVDSYDDFDDEDDYSTAQEWVAYATAKAVFIRKLQADLPAMDTAGEEGDLSIFSLPSSSSSAIRSIKLITPTLCLVLANLPRRTGAELILVSFPTNKKASVASRHPLHKTIKAATAMSTLRLAKKPSSTSQHNHQVLIAVAGADCSVSVTVLNLTHGSSPADPHSHLSSVSWRAHRTYTSEHAFPATAVAFSPAPLPPPTISMHEDTHYVRLASVSAANTVSVHTLTLSDAHSLSRSSKFSVTVVTLVFSTIFIILLALMLQVVFEYRYNRPGGMKEKMEGLAKDMSGVVQGVKDGVSREMLAGMFEGIFAANG